MTKIRIDFTPAFQGRYRLRSKEERKRYVTSPNDMDDDYCEIGFGDSDWSGMTDCWDGFGTDF